MIRIRKNPPSICYKCKKQIKDLGGQITSDDKGYNIVVMCNICYDMEER